MALLVGNEANEMFSEDLSSQHPLLSKMDFRWAMVLPIEFQSG